MNPLSSPFLDALRAKVARGEPLSLDEAFQLLDAHDSLLTAYHETAFLRTSRASWRNELGQISGFGNDVRKYGDLPSFPRPEPMRNEDMPDREWTDLEWTRNQWHLADEHCATLKAELEETRAALSSIPTTERTAHALGWKDDELVQVASCSGVDVNFVIDIYEWRPCSKCGKELKLVQTNDILEREAQ